MINIEFVLEKDKPYLETYLVDGKCPYSEKTKEDFLEENPDFIISDNLAYIDRLLTENENKEFIHPWKETTEKEWFELFETLPPYDWNRNGSTESWRCPEAFSNNIYTYGVRIAKRYFFSNRRLGITHAEMIKEISEQLKNNKEEVK